MHKHWSQIKQLYIESNRVFSYPRLKSYGRWRALGPALGVLGLIIALSGTLFIFNHPVGPVACVTGIALAMIVFFRSVDKLLARLYPCEYEQYDIAQQRLSERVDYLAYALFIQRIKALGYTPARLEAISEYSETLSQPPKPFLINQHFMTMIMISILVSLFSAYLQKTSSWSTQALEYILTAAAMTFVLGLVLDGFRVTQTRDGRIRRYLKRASIELTHEANAQAALSETPETLTHPVGNATHTG